MLRTSRFALGVAMLGVAILAFATATAAVPPLQILETDLEPLIRAGATSPTQFAVSIPRAVSTAKNGKWSTVNGQSTWTYAAQIPTAISLSFHAARITLPPSAILTVRGASTTAIYRGRELHHAELWSRVQPGDTLQFDLQVAAAEQAQAVLEITSFQAGYRSLAPGVKDHPLFRRIQAQGAAATNAACAQNYECSVNSTIAPAGQATVGLIVGNIYQCSGTLINDVPGDNTPYVLTARHCEAGTWGGGNPGAASSVTVYFDATTACGGDMGSLYDGNIPMQQGARTMVEQEDAWLLQLDSSPVVNDAQYAGFDARGGLVQGGYTIHHALGFDKQYTTWYGQAYAYQESNLFGTTFVSNFLQTVNLTGNTGPGASGSGLFDQANHLVGSLSLGRSGDASGYESCPAPNPVAPNGTNGSNDFTALAAIWNSTADATSSTGTMTLESVLDPANTGTMVVTSAPAAHVYFDGPVTISVSTPAPLTWTAAGATQCTASGGVAGDGWSGTLPAAGSKTITESSTGVVTYRLSCALPGGRVAGATLTTAWVPPTPELTLSGPYSVWAARPATLNWSSNTAPCTLAGGGLALTNLASSGSTTTTQASAGDVTYTMTCGPANSQVQQNVTVIYVTPSVTFIPNGTDRLVTEPFTLQWYSLADSCTPSGGAPDDGWTTTEFFAPDTMPLFSPHVTALGTYTYTLNCSSGPLSVQKSVTVTIENNAPYTSSSVDKTTTTFSSSTSSFVVMSWISNLTRCAVNSTPNGAWIYPQPWPGMGEIYATDSATWEPPQPGTYVLTVTCSEQLFGIDATSPPITITVLPPPPPTAQFTINPKSALTGSNVTLAWSSTNASGCVAESSGPASVTLWANGQSLGASGTEIVSVNSIGDYTFGMTCHSIDKNQGSVSAEASLTVSDPIPTATLSASPTSLTVGDSVKLTWSSTNSTGCTASSGGADGTWNGSLASSGSVTQKATMAGTFTFTITCQNEYQTASTHTTVTVSAAASSGGGGGGGSFDLIELAAIASLTLMRGASRSRRSSRR